MHVFLCRVKVRSEINIVHSYVLVKSCALIEGESDTEHILIYWSLEHMKHESMTIHLSHNQ